ncbi:MAG: mechanosensitive ion channel domain-containing protein [Cyanobacteria bacterium J06621_8]
MTKKILTLVLTIITSLIFVITNQEVGQTQVNHNLFPHSVQFEELQIYNDPSVLKAPVSIDGRAIFSVGKIDNKPAGERALSIRGEILEAVSDSSFAEVVIEEQGGLPVLYLVYNRPAANDSDSDAPNIRKDRHYLFTVTRKDTIGRRSNRETALDLKSRIEQAIAQAKKERSSAYLLQQGFISFVLLLLTIFCTRLLNHLQRYSFREAMQQVIPWLAKKNNSQPSSLTTLFRLKLGLAQFVLWTATILIILRQFPSTRQWLYFLFYLLSTILANTFNESVLSFGGESYSLFSLLFLLGLLVAAVIVSSYITNLLRSNVLQATRMTRGSQEIISTFTKYGLISFSTIVLLQAYGLDLSSLTLIGSALGVGIGFGFQDIARNFASGIVLLFERSIQAGDFIQVGEHLGVVEEVRSRSIVLKTLDDISIIVPNSRFLTEEVINWHHRRSISRVHLPIGVAYGSDIKKVKSALLQAAAEHVEVLRNPPSQVFFTEFGDSSLNFELLIWTSEPSRQAPLKSDLYFRIEELFNEQEIEVPFPQRDVNLKAQDLPIKLTPQLEGQLISLLKGLVSQQHQNNHVPVNKVPGKKITSSKINASKPGNKRYES